MRISVHDELPPEASAMLQALYSRSADSVDDHLAKVRERGADRFMSSYYVGYGHASIGDCGYTTLFIENISLLACKAVQDNPLYSGQETSTRYLDFSRRPMVDPIRTPASAAVLARWMAFYADAEPILRQHLLETLERPAQQSGGAWRKAVAARCFDVLRGFLPAGVTSQLAWTTSLRQAHDHGLRLMTHPLVEVREVGGACLDALRRRYPSSFGQEPSPEDLDYLRMTGAAEAYATPGDIDSPFIYDCGVDNAALERECLELVAARPRRRGLPKSLSRFGVYRCRFPLDFGSFRDLQRHRGGLCRMPLLTDRFGLHDWYLGRLPPDLRARAESLLAEQAAAVEALRGDGVSETDLQYLQPIGMLVSCELVYDLPQMVYVAELRSGSTVHPTLRVVAQAMAKALRREHPRLALYIDESGDSFSVRRGMQDITDLGLKDRRPAG